MAKNYPFHHLLLPAGSAAAVNAVAHLMTGHDNVAVYDGSMDEWLGEKLPTIGTGKWEVWK